MSKLNGVVSATLRTQFSTFAHFPLTTAKISRAAQNAAQQALLVLDNAASAAENSVSSETIADLEWELASHRGWYLFALARAQLVLGENKVAIASLETAKAQTKQQYDPELYIWILQELQQLKQKEHECMGS